MTSQTEQPQHEVARERANEIRVARAALKRRIGAGECAVGEVIEPGYEIPEEARLMPVMQLLNAQRGWSYTRSGKLLSPLGISEQRLLGELTTRQRRLLIEALHTRPSDRRDERLLAA